MINVGSSRLTTVQAANRLGVKPATLYAYVSRGVLHSDRGSEGSTFDAQEVERLAGSSRRATAGGAGRLAFATALTLIQDGVLYYRGEDATRLAGERTFEEVAEWLWRGEWRGLASWPAPAPAVEVAEMAQAGLPAASLPIDRLKVIVASAATVDELRCDTAAPAAMAAARALLATMVDALPPAGDATRSRLTVGKRRVPSEALAARLWSRLTAEPASPGRLAAVNAALVLLADHELAASTLAVRVAAAFRADPYASVGTGLGAASGAWHGGSSVEVEGILHDVMAGDAARVIGARLRRGQTIAGFGQPLYPAGDPRAVALLEWLPALRSRPRRRAAVKAVLTLAGSRGFPPPNVDFALGAIAFCCEMIPGAGEAIFVVGRTAGWIGHALEEYASRTTFRARCAYVGRPPSAMTGG
jgi:citrate synthase